VKPYVKGNKNDRNDAEATARNPFNPGTFEAGRLIEMKTRGYSIRARGDQGLTNRPDIWEQLRSPTQPPSTRKVLANRRSPYMR
jgi:hypothetical protein